MILGIIFTIVVIVIVSSLINGNDSEANTQAIGGTIFFLIAGTILSFIMNALLDGCTK
jgi:hypothetical protein